MSEVGAIANERQITFIPRGGHDHDGDNSSVINLPNGSISLSKLDANVIQYIQSNSSSANNILNVPQLQIITNTIAPGGSQDGATKWVNIALIISTAVNLIGNSQIDLKFYKTASYNDSDLEFHAANVANGFVYSGVWAHNDLTESQQLYWRVTNTGGENVSATITLKAGTAAVNSDTPHVSSIDVLNDHQDPATGDLLFVSGTGVHILRDGNTFTWTSAPMNGPNGEPPPIPPPTDLELTTGVDTTTSIHNVWIKATWIAPDDSQFLDYEAELTKVGFGVVDTIKTHLTNCTFNNVEPDTDYTVRVLAISTAGQISSYAGPVSIHSANDSTVPSQVTNLTVGAGFKSLTISWDDVVNVPIKWYRVLIDTVNTFNSVNLIELHPKGSITGISNALTTTTYYVKVKAVSTSNIEGPFSAIVSATTGAINTIDLTDGSITTVKLGLTIGGDNIVLNSSFEADKDSNGLADSWNIYNDPSSDPDPTFSIGNTLYTHGSKSQRVNITTNTNYKGIYQLTVPTLHNKLYSISIFINPTVDSDWQIYCPRLTTAAGPIETLSANTWTRLKYAGATASSTSIDIYIRTTAANLNVNFDGCQVEQGDIVTAYAPKPDEILPFTIIGEYIAQETIGEIHIQDAAITNAKIGVLAVGTANIQDAAIANAKIRDLAVDTAKINSLAVTTAKIANLAVDTAQINSLAVTTAKIDNLAVTNAKINDLSVTKLTAGTIDTSLITLNSTIEHGGSGLLRAGTSGSPFNYILFDSSGIRSYKTGSAAFTGGTLTFHLDNATGNAFFSGTVDASQLTGNTITGGTLNIGPDKFVVLSDGTLEFSSGCRLLDDDFYFRNYDGSKPIARFLNESLGGSDYRQWLMLGNAADHGPAGLYFDSGLGRYIFDCIVTDNLQFNGSTSHPPWFNTDILLGYDHSGGIYANSAGSGTDTNWGFQFANNFTNAISTNILYNGSSNVVRDDRSGFYNTATSTYVAYASNTGTWVVPSSGSIKRDIVTLDDIMPAVRQLNPVSYNYNFDPETNSNRLGFIAEEMADIFPEVVDFSGSTAEAIAYDYLIPIAIKAIQQLDTRLSAVETAIL